MTKSKDFQALKAHVSAATLSRMWRVHRTTVERQLAAAGIAPVYFGGAKRYRLEDVERWLRERSPPQRGRRPLV